jgi:hypothetical protein
MRNPYELLGKSKVQTVDAKTGDVFNPLDFGKKGRSGTRSVSASSKMFNEAGELNASSKADALDKIAGILEGLRDGSFQVDRKASFDTGLTDQDSEAILREAFSDPSSEGFKLVGQGLLNPIKEVIDYEGLARKIWAPRTVKAGEVVRYDKDPFVKAFMIGEDGQTPESKWEGRYVYPPEFEITAFPTLEIKDKYRAQFDILARIQDRARQSIEHREDVAAINLLMAGGNVVNTTTFFASLNLAALESMRYQIERHRLVCDKFIINRQEVSDIVNVLSLQVDPVTLRELIMAGYIGQVLNAWIVTTAGTNTFEVLDPGEAVAVTSPEYLGGMPIRVELFSEPINQFMMGFPDQGWFWYELLGMVLINPAGVALGSKT